MNEYWDIHVRTILRLQELGFKFKLHDRLPIFRLWLLLIKMGRRNPKLQRQIQACLEDLDLLKALRCEGLEPELENKNRYKNGT